MDVGRIETIARTEENGQNSSDHLQTLPKCISSIVSYIV